MNKNFDVATRATILTWQDKTTHVLIPSRAVTRILGEAAQGIRGQGNEPPLVGGGDVVLNHVGQRVRLQTKTSAPAAQQ